MDIEKDIIKDQKETIHRLQEECKEKTDIIMALEQENADIKRISIDIIYKVREENYKYYKALEEIREIAKENIKEKVHNPDIDIILDKINEVME